jgi:hypothetical protein
MSGQQPPLTCAEFKTILGRLGFSKRPMKSGTSHEDWVKTDENGRFYKVTVDCPKAPFSQDLIKSMAKQAGVTKRQIYDVYFGRYQDPETAAVPSTRFEARSHVVIAGVQYWCVWDTHLDVLAHSGSLTYLAEDVAMERAATMNAA